MGNLDDAAVGQKFYKESIKFCPGHIGAYLVGNGNHNARMLSDTQAQGADMAFCCIKGSLIFIAVTFIRCGLIVEGHDLGITQICLHLCRVGHASIFILDFVHREYLTSKMP